MQDDRTEDRYEVWSFTTVGPMRTLESGDEAEATERLRYLRAAQLANGFGGRAWMTRNGEDFEPGV